MGSKLLLLDFDGTVCLGDAPVLVYAQHVDALLRQRGLAAVSGGGVHQIVQRAFAENTLAVSEIAWDSAGQPVGVGQAQAGQAHPLVWPLQDGYQLVQLLGQQAGLTPEETGQAFRSARVELVAAGLAQAGVHAPPGLGKLLTQLRQQVVVALITNSPAQGFGPWLDALGLNGTFDAVVNDARKPSGMPAAIEQVLAHLNEPPQATEMLSVGDIWANDLEHVHQRRGSTILIDRFDTGLGDPTHRVTSWEQAEQRIRTWAGAESEY